MSDNIPDSLRVLFVDDEQNILSALKRSVRRNRRSWLVEFAVSGKEALDYLAKAEFDLVVSDVRMPGMDGIELLAEVKRIQPQAIRFLLTGYSNKESTLEAMKLAHQCFAKPSDPLVIIAAIERSDVLHKRINNNEVCTFISSLESVPSPPIVFKKLQAELEKSDSSYEVIADIVCTDAALSAKILQLVNSAFFGIQQDISEIKEGLFILGVEIIKSLVMIFGMGIKYGNSIRHFFLLEKFFAHSAEVAKLSKEIALYFGLSKKEAESAFTAGLLHDIGKLIFASYRPKEYRDISIHSNESKSVHITHLEKSAFNASHANIGAHLMSLWGLPLSVVEVIAFHDRPSSFSGNTDKLSILTAVHLADHISNDRAQIKDGEPVIGFGLDMVYISSLEEDEEIAAKLKKYIQKEKDC